MSRKDQIVSMLDVYYLLEESQGEDWSDSVTECRRILEDKLKNTKAEHPFNWIEYAYILADSMDQEDAANSKFHNWWSNLKTRSWYSAYDIAREAFEAGTKA